MGSSETSFFVWSPAIFGAGAAYALERASLGPWAPLLLLSVTIACLAAAARILGAWRTSYGLGAFACALGGAAWAEAAVARNLAATPAVMRDGVAIEGRVANADQRGARVRLTLDEVTLRDQPFPARIRVTAPGDAELLMDRRIGVRASLRPFSGPAMPGGYDFARAAYFRGVAATGFAYGRPKVIEPALRSDAWTTLQRAWSRARVHLAARARAASPGAGGGMAAALTTGLRGGVPEHAAEWLRIAGLAHLLAISGLHVGLVAGVAFFTVRFVAACVPAVALRLSTKKIAAIAALIAATAYLFLSGASVSTQRAYVMAVLAFTAIALDRRAISMRLVAIAAWIVLVIRPNAALEAGFQMSFLATAALVAAFQIRRGGDPKERSWLGRVRDVGMGVVLANLVAGSATGVAAAHHFGRTAPYGLIANVVAEPLLAFWVLPAGMVAVLSAPLGADAWPFAVMGAGCDAILWIAGRTAALPGAEAAVPTGSSMSLFLVCLAVLWGCLWRGPVRAVAVVFALGAWFAWAHAPRPDVLIAEEGGTVAIRASDGALAIARGRGGAFTIDVWGRSEGGPLDAKRDARTLGVQTEDLGGRVWRTRSGVIVAAPTSWDAAVEDCRVADLVVLADRYASTALRRTCAARIVDRGELETYGSHAVFVDEHSHLRIARARAVGRPWGALNSDE